VRLCREEDYKKESFAMVRLVKERNGSTWIFSTNFSMNTPCASIRQNTQYELLTRNKKGYKLNTDDGKRIKTAF